MKQALRVATAVEENNAGRPFDRINLGKTLGMSPGSSSFRSLITSSIRYGLTQGGQKAQKVELTELGRCIVSPTVTSDVRTCIERALTYPDLFSKIFNYFNDKKIPREQVFKNTLRSEFNILHEDLEDCYKVIMGNATDYNLINTVQGNQYLQMSELISPAEVESIEEKEENGELEELVVEKSITEKQIPKQIFIAHGKNNVPLDQLKDILTQFKVQFQVAIDEPHKGRPITQKVADLMKNCSHGIFIFTADEETAGANGDKISRPSDNVVFELGAGTILYQDRIVIFREEGVEFGSDFTDYGRISFEKNNLRAKGLDLMKELISMGFLEVSPKS